MIDECITPSEGFHLSAVDRCHCIAGGSPRDCPIHKLYVFCVPPKDCTCGRDA